MESDLKRLNLGLLDLPPEMQKKVQELVNPPMPVWHAEAKGVPNICLRSALFIVIQRGKRVAVKKETVAAVKGLDIRYTGWRLGQGDFDVLAHALHLSRQQQAGGQVQFTVKGFLRGIGRAAGKSGREWLKDVFRRLAATALEIKLEVPGGNRFDTFTYAGSFIDEFHYDAAGQGYFLRINPQLAKLFDAGWTQLQWQQRLFLKTDLAKWLHGFFTSCLVPFQVKVATLKHLCGSNYGRLADFRRSLRMALDELVESGAISAWKIDEEDRMQVERNQPNTISEE